MSKRKGRGHLSSIEQLPIEAKDIVAWAAAELQKRDRTQKDILAEFNQKLHELDPEIEPISSSAFNRHSLRLAAMTNRMAEVREIAQSVSANLDGKTSDELTMIGAEAIKTLIFELVTDAPEGDVTPLEAMRLAAALKNASHAQHISTERRAKVERDFEKDVNKAIDKVAALKGISSDTASDLKQKILGINGKL